MKLKILYHDTERIFNDVLSLSFMQHNNGGLVSIHRNHAKYISMGKKQSIKIIMCAGKVIYCDILDFIISVSNNVIHIVPDLAM